MTCDYDFLIGVCSICSSVCMCVCVCVCVLFFYMKHYQSSFSHSPSAARRDSFVYTTCDDFQNIRNLRFVSDIAWSISIHTDKKEIEQCVLCVYLVSWDVFTKAFVS
jgi:hypothetical protein